MKLLPLDSPDRIRLVAGWLSREENYRWTDFGEGQKPLSELALKFMTQRDNHLLRVFTADGSDQPIGMVGLSDVHCDAPLHVTGCVWAVLSSRQYAGYLRRAATRVLTYAFRDLGLEVVSAWVVEADVESRRVLEQLNFTYAGRLRRRHWIDGRPYDRLMYDLLASEHREDARLAPGSRAEPAWWVPPATGPAPGART